MDLQFGPEIIDSYKRLSYDIWYALAEFIDNSTDAYLSNKELLDPILEVENTPLFVKIDYNSDDQILTIEDNSLGMSVEELTTALVIGKKPTLTSGRSRYGLGMKTAACWLGNYWTVRTKKLNDTTEHKVSIDVARIVQNNTDVNHQTLENQEPGSHYTVITISNLNRNIANRTKGTIRNYLRSIYRKDFENYGLKILYDGVELEWNSDEMIYNKLHETRDGNKTKKDLDFVIGEGENEKRITGWVGVFKKGSRKDAGFSIIQSNRVIKGWPNSYRPFTLYGDGRNDLVNQRLVGEIYLDQFAVSHTKDEIIFLGNEEEELEAKLLEHCADYKAFAQEYRKYLDDERVASEDDSSYALNLFEKEINSSELHDKISTMTIPESKTVRETKLNLIQAVTSRALPDLKAKIDDLGVLIYLDSQMSANDPYILIESTQSKDRVIVIVNKAHPHWSYLKNHESILNFLRHCVYDGISEWRAYFKTGKLDPDTIKHIKDGLLRVPMEMEEHEKD